MISSSSGSWFSHLGESVIGRAARRMSSAAASVLSRVAVPPLPWIGRILTRSQPVSTDPATQAVPSGFCLLNQSPAEFN